MITMEAIIENHEHGGYLWRAFLRDEPDPSTPEVLRSRLVGKLVPSFDGLTLGGTKDKIHRTAGRLRAKLLRITLHIREVRTGGHLGNIIEHRTLWEAES